MLALISRGFMDGQTFIFALSMVPAMLIGACIGIKNFRRLDARFFRGLTMVIVICAGLLGIVSGLGLISWGG